MPTARFTPRVVVESRRCPDDRDVLVAHHQWFNSWKAGAMIAHRGLLAGDFLTLAETNPDVVVVSNDTDPIEWWDGDHWNCYFPRFVVTIQTELPGVYDYVDVEVLDSARANHPRFKRIRRAALEQQRVFHVFNELHVRKQPRLTNSQLILAQAGDGLVLEGEREVVRELLRRYGSVSVDTVVARRALDYPQAYSAILNMVSTGELEFSLGRLFDGATRVRRRTR